MAFSVADFDDLVRLLTEHPEWRAQLRPLVLGEEMLSLPSRMDRVEAALEKLTVRVDALTDRVDALTVQVDVLTTSVTNLSAAVMGIHERMDRLDGRMGNAEGELLETRFDRNMPQWVVDFVFRPSRVYVDDLPAISAAVSAGILSHSDRRDIATLDSMIRGLDVGDGEETILAVEVSSTINAEDIERAAARTTLLARTGLRVKALVCGYRISTVAESMADDRGVLVSLRRRPA